MRDPKLRARDVDMIYHRLLLCITIIAFFLIQADAEASDPLDPSQLGESMSMPLPQELIQDAMNAGVIKESNPLYKPDRKQPSLPVTPQPEADAVNSVDNVNVTGTWSFNLTGKDPEEMKLYLTHNEDLVMGHGVIIRANEMENATASGSISGDEMSLIVMPIGVLDLYKLNLSLSTLAAGTYTVHMADGSSKSGEVTFAVYSNIFKPASTVAKDGRKAYETADSEPATPVQLSGAKGQAPGELK